MTAMTKKIISQIRLECESLTDEELKNKAYDAIYDSLGTQVDAMVEFGYDASDIADCVEYESFVRNYSELIQLLCDERGIILFGE